MKKTKTIELSVICYNQALNLVVERLHRDWVVRETTSSQTMLQMLYKQLSALERVSVQIFLTSLLF